MRFPHVERAPAGVSFLREGLDGGDWSFFAVARAKRRAFAKFAKRMCVNRHVNLELMLWDGYPMQLLPGRAIEFGVGYRFGSGWSVSTESCGAHGMFDVNDNQAVGRVGSDGFQTTHWSVVLAAGDGAGAAAGSALEVLCKTYWFPLYAYVRRRGYSFHEAQDLTQDFFRHLLEGAGLRSADRSKGRFRAYVIGALNHFLANEWDKAHRLKRGGGREIFSWEGLHPEEQYQHEPSQSLAPEKILDRAWAQVVVAEALKKLRGEAIRENAELRFDALKKFLSNEGGEQSYAAVAESLNLSESAVKSAIHRLRRRFAELFRAEVAQTVASAEEAEAEIRHLFAALGD